MGTLNNYSKVRTYVPTVFNVSPSAPVASGGRESAREDDGSCPAGERILAHLPRLSFSALSKPPTLHQATSAAPGSIAMHVRCYEQSCRSMYGVCMSQTLDSTRLDLGARLGIRRPFSDTSPDASNATRPRACGLVSTTIVHQPMQLSDRQSSSCGDTRFGRLSA